MSTPQFKPQRSRMLAGTNKFSATVLTAAALLVVAGTAGRARADPASAPLHWLSGHWCNASASGMSEEYWLPSQPDLMLGVSRTVRKGKSVAFEFLRISEHEGIPTYFAQPGGRTATAFKQTASGDNWVRFENPAHDFPTRIEYRRDGDTLNAQIAGPGKDGKEKVIPFVYVRCAGASNSG